MKTLSLVLLSTLSTAAMASAVNVELQRNKDGDVDPTTRFAFQWSDQLFSEVHFRKTTFSDIDTSESLNRSYLSLDNQYLRLDALGYRNDANSAAFTAGVESIFIQRDEFGFGDVNGTSLNIDNQVEIQVYKLLLTGRYRYDQEYFAMNASAELSPWGSLSVDQDTSISYTSDMETQYSGSDSLDPSWGANLELVFKTGWDIDFGLAAEYETLPLKYDFDVLNSTADAFETSRVEQDQTTLRTRFRIVLPSYGEEGRPVIGLTNEKITTKEDGEEFSETVHYVVLGYEQGF